MSSKHCDKAYRCASAWWCADDYEPDGECFIALKNTERIRNMANEELACWLAIISSSKPKSATEWLDWLEQEVTNV